MPDTVVPDATEPPFKWNKASIKVLNGLIALHGLDALLYSGFEACRQARFALLAPRTYPHPFPFYARPYHVLSTPYPPFF